MGGIRVLLWILIVLLLGFVSWRRYKRGQLMAIIWVLAGIVLAVYIGLGAVLFLIQSRILYQPSREYDYTPEDVGLAYEAVALETANGHSITGWYIPAKSGTAEDAWTVLFCHGNAGNISHRLYTLELIHDLGLNCLIVDYRGYGASGGHPTEEGTLQDIRAGWDWLVNEKGKPANRIILFGRSLGGSIAAIVAEKVNPGAVIIESAFTSFVDIAKHYYPYMPVRFFVRFDYDTRKAVKALKCPVLIIHSRDDEIVPYRFGEALFEAASKPKLFRELQGGHNEGFYENAELYQRIWKEWLDYLNTAEATSSLK